MTLSLRRRVEEVWPSGELPVPVEFSSAPIWLEVSPGLAEARARGTGPVPPPPAPAPELQPLPEGDEAQILGL